MKVAVNMRLPNGAEKTLVYGAKLIAVARVSEGERIANDVNNISQCRSVRRRRTSKLTQR